ncbi:hypothetical protein J6590_084923 [Homalodisca vitripennis]|nr:hypothetical protein J6590_084923 [Homalodisca vitripennis]
MKRNVGVAGERFVSAAALCQAAVDMCQIHSFMAPTAGHNIYPSVKFCLEEAKTDLTSPSSKVTRLALSPLFVLNESNKGVRQDGPPYSNLTHPATP